MSDAFRYISVYHHRELVENNVKRPGLLNRYWLLHPNSLEENLLVNCTFFGTVPLSLLHSYLTKRFLFILLKHFTSVLCIKCEG